MKRNTLQILLCGAIVATAGVAAEAQPFGRGGPDRDDMRNRVSMILRLADENGDNTVTRAEVESFQDEMFVWMDRNADGYLDLEDQSPVNRRMAELREREESERGGRGLFGPRGHDGEGRGQRGGRLPGGPGMTGGAPRGADTDEDGRISRAEFMDMETRLFEHLDANGDDAITPEELDARVDAAQERSESRRFWWRD